MRQSRLALAHAAVALAFVVGCSSIPEVTFVDVDGGKDAGSSSDARDPTPPWSCPDNPPPDDKGICCPGDRLCLRCTPSQCDRCRDERCSSITACCAREGGSNRVDCRIQQTCL